MLTDFHWDQAKKRMGQNFDDYPGPAQKNTCLKICNTVYNVYILNSEFRTIIFLCKKKVPEKSSILDAECAVNYGRSFFLS